MTAWHVDAGLNVLIGQVKTLHPGIVVGTIGDPAHRARKSDHNPEADGSVDAADFMVGPHFSTLDCENLVTALTVHSDHRILYIIWMRHIWYPNGKGWRPYHGTDPHTGHAHLSVNDKFPGDLREWNLDMHKASLMWIPISGKLPILHEGDRDSDYDGYNLIARLQGIKGIKQDGVWGPATSKALGVKAITTAAQWKGFLGLT